MPVCSRAITHVPACVGQQVGAARSERAQPQAHLAGRAGGNAAVRSFRRLQRRQEPALLLALGLPARQPRKGMRLVCCRACTAVVLHPHAMQRCLSLLFR